MSQTPTGMNPQLVSRVLLVYFILASGNKLMEYLATIETIQEIVSKLNKAERKLILMPDVYVDEQEC